MRTILLAGLLSTVLAGGAFADASVAGNWRASMENNVSIDMQISPDGHWSSETREGSRAVRQMQGTYQQSRSGNDQGTLVFTPTEARTQSGTVGTETDQYELGQNGQQLKLTSNGDTLTFDKQK